MVEVRCWWQMHLINEDVTMSWGMSSMREERHHWEWRLAVFQDMQQSFDASQLFFLYDPDEDEKANGLRRGAPSLLVFDLHVRCFVAEIELDVKGRLKNLFALKSAGPSGGTSLIVVTERFHLGDPQLQLHLVEMRADGRGVAMPPRLLHAFPVDTGHRYMVTMREDAPVAVLLTSPPSSSPHRNISTHKNISKLWTIRTDQPGVLLCRDVLSLDVSLFYDGFVFKNWFVLLATMDREHLDPTLLHRFSMEKGWPIEHCKCFPDQDHGFPAHRKDAAINQLLMVGGEVWHSPCRVTRLTDMWTLDLNTFVWAKVFLLSFVERFKMPESMPLLLIEPRLTSTAAGHVFLWGDFDQPLPDMPSFSTHLRVIKMRDFENLVRRTLSEESLISLHVSDGSQSPSAPFARSDMPSSVYTTVHGKPSAWIVPSSSPVCTTPKTRSPRVSYPSAPRMQRVTSMSPVHEHASLSVIPDFTIVSICRPLAARSPNPLLRKTVESSAIRVSHKKKQKKKGGRGHCQLQ